MWSQNSKQQTFSLDRSKKRFQSTCRDTRQAPCMQWPNEGRKKQGHESLLFYTCPLGTACRWPMANGNDCFFHPTFTSASPELFIKYLLYAKPMLGPGDTEITKTRSLPLKRFSLSPVRENRYINQQITMHQCASAPREVLEGVGGAE